MVKFVQIACSESVGANGEQSDSLLALDDKGRVWVHVAAEYVAGKLVRGPRWKRLPGDDSRDEA
jgi:hypothetical protein